MTIIIKIILYMNNRSQLVIIIMISNVLYNKYIFIIKV